MSSLFDFSRRKAADDATEGPGLRRGFPWPAWWRTGRNPLASPQFRFYQGPPTEGPGWFWTPRVVGPRDYPLDLDASERFPRPRKGLQKYFPHPYIQQTWDQNPRPMGAISGFSPLMSVWLHLAYGNNPSGPVAGTDYGASFSTYIYPQTPKKAS